MDEHGGAARVYSYMASKWAEEGREVVFQNHFGRALSQYPIDGRVKIFASIFKTIPSKVLRSLLSPFLLPVLLRRIVKEKPDVLIVNNGPYYGQFIGVIAGKLTKTPVVIWKHTGYYALSSFLYKCVRRLCFPLADAVVFLTKGDESHVESYVKQSFIIPNPNQNGSVSIAYKQESKVALTVGRLSQSKNFDHLIKAWKLAEPLITGWKLEIVGDGDYRSELEKEASDLKSIKFEGSTDNVAKYYRKAGFFVMSSMHEGLPMVLIEATAYGLPCISYDCKYGPAEIIDDGKTGILVENGNIDALYKAIVRMAEDSAFREACSKNTLDRIKKFSTEQICRQWDEVFESVVKHDKK
ncbi:hypothetical protein AAG570_014035 [Ranatra chinensis]|uniref:Glycosyltransferase n=1 Tax=Ranatra chinensis TaxID=642074 RepID=A0ABD0XSC8_9HEMI